MRIFLAATLVLLGCSHRVTRPQPGSRIERTVALMPDSEPGGLFPQISDPTRASSLLAARNAPLCSLDLNSTTSTWDEVQTPIESRYLKAVALRLPPGFMPAEDEGLQPFVFRLGSCRPGILILEIPTKRTRRSWPTLASIGGTCWDLGFDSTRPRQGFQPTSPFG